MHFPRLTWSTFVVLTSWSLLVAPAAHSQTVITGMYTGADGASGGGTLNTDNNITYGDNAENGYLAPNPDGTTFEFDGAMLTGGVGGEVFGTDGAADYQGGDGGNGLLSQAGGTATGPQVIVNSGTYTGGTGGAASGTGNSLTGGYGGSGLDVNNSIAIVNGGTFTGGDSGTASGTSDNIGSGFAGSGLNSNSGATVTVNAGTFQGGNGATTAGGTGSPGDGIVVLGGTTNVYGGTFAGGTGNQDGFGIDLFDGSVMLYGSSFTVTDTDHNTVTPNFSGDLGPGQGFITGLFTGNTAPTTFSYRVLDFGGTFDIASPAAAPEPSQFAALGIGLLGLSTLALRARRHQAA